MKKFRPRILVIFSIFIFALAGFFFQYFGRSWNHSLFIQPIYQLDTDQKVVALTFDDGPSSERTPALLDLLDKHQIRATFFMLGQNIEKYPEVAKKVVKQGHMASNHSYSHPRMLFKSPAYIKEEIIKTNQLLKNIGSNDYQFFRPPYTSKFVILPWVLRSLDMKLVTGTYDPLTQYQRPFPTEKVTQQVIDNIRPGTIVYLHDENNNDVELFIEAVDKIISTLKRQGYTFVTVKGE